MTGYSERVVRATRQVLLEVFQLLDNKSYPSSSA
jgi:hypothetical protein